MASTLQAQIPHKLRLTPYRQKFANLSGINVDQLQFFDGGAQAAIYTIANLPNTVLKVTFDRREAKFCQFLKQRKFRRSYLPKIYSVYQIDKTYLIHMEYLEECSFNTTLQNIIDNGYFNPFSRKYLTALKHIASTTSAHSKYCSTAYLFFNFLKSLKIDNYDYHIGNIMYRAKTRQYVFIDYGFLSKCPALKAVKLQRILE